MTHPVMFRYLSYSITLAEHAAHHLRRCPAFCRDGTCLFLFVQLDAHHPPNGWTHDLGLTHVGAMVKNQFLFEVLQKANSNLRTRSSCTIFLFHKIVIFFFNSQNHHMNYTLSGILIKPLGIKLDAKTQLPPGFNPLTLGHHCIKAPT